MQRKEEEGFAGIDHVVELGCGVAGYGGLALGQHPSVQSVLFVDKEPGALIQVAAEARARGMEKKCRYYPCSL